MDISKNAAPSATDLAQRIADARDFYDELLDSAETLSGIAEIHGVRTLADAMYLQNAILGGSYIEVEHDGESRIVDVVSTLPSHAKWMPYIQQLHAEETRPKN